MFSSKEFLDLIGWAEWAAEYVTDDEGVVTFSSFVFDTLPPVLQLFFIVFILNWVMGIISHGCKLRFGGRM